MRGPGEGQSPDLEVEGTLLRCGDGEAGGTEEERDLQSRVGRGNEEMGEACTVPGAARRVEAAPLRQHRSPAWHTLVYSERWGKLLQAP